MTPTHLPGGQDGPPSPDGEAAGNVVDRLHERLKQIVTDLFNSCLDLLELEITRGQWLAIVEARAARDWVWEAKECKAEIQHEIKGADADGRIRHCVNCVISSVRRMLGFIPQYRAYGSDVDPDDERALLGPPTAHSHERLQVYRVEARVRLRRLEGLLGGVSEAKELGLVPGRPREDLRLSHISILKALAESPVPLGPVGISKSGVTVSRDVVRREVRELLRMKLVTQPKPGKYQISEDGRAACRTAVSRRQL